MGTLTRAISSDGFVKMCVVDACDIVERARVMHGTTPVVTAALGRTLSAASIMGNQLKGRGASMTVRINGGGPCGSIIVVSDPEGNVRGYVQEPRANLPNRPDGKLDVGGVVGTNGLITVIKDVNLKEPYIGSTQLISGEIAEDVTAYLVESEQTPAACALGVLVSTADQHVIAAGGYIVELLPGADEELISALEKSIADAGPVTTMLEKGIGTDGIIHAVIGAMDPQILTTEHVEYRCFCSHERAYDIVKSLAVAELEDMLKDGEDIEVGCQFCDSKYVFTPRDLSEMIADKLANPDDEDDDE